MNIFLSNPPLKYSNIFGECGPKQSRIHQNQQFPESRRRRIQRRSGFNFANGSSINDVTQYWKKFYTIPHHCAFYYHGLWTVVTKSLIPQDRNVIYGRPLISFLSDCPTKKDRLKNNINFNVLLKWSNFLQYLLWNLIVEFDSDSSNEGRKQKRHWNWRCKFYLGRQWKRTDTSKHQFANRKR